MRRVIAIIAFLSLGGCSVMQTLRNDINAEVKGFQEDWQRTFGHERTN